MNLISYTLQLILNSGREMGPISHLPKGLINHLHSSSVLSNFPQAVEELICNSLDAGAKKVYQYFSSISSHELIMVCLCLGFRI